MRAVTAAQARAVDAYACDRLHMDEMTLIERSGRALYQLCAEKPHERYCILCGGGNNGADGAALGQLLAQAGKQVLIVVLFERCNASCSKLLLRAARDGCKIERFFLKPDLCREAIRTCDCIVDGIFGTGFRSGGENPAAQVIDYVNAQNKAVYAIDIPSGADADCGRVDCATVRAEETWTLCLYKPGLFLYPAADCCGKVTLLDIGMPREALCGVETSYEVAEAGFHHTVLIKRAANSHKGDFGHLYLLGGSLGMSGSIALAARAAQRTGAGKVTVGCPSRIGDILAIKLEETMTHPMASAENGGFSASAAEAALQFSHGAEAVALGCGLRCGEEQVQFVRTFLAGCKKPLVLDADGLNVLAIDPSMLEHRTCEVLLTPHPGEMARLLRTTPERVNGDRLACARTLAARYGVTVALKGAGTVVASPDGTTFINTSGNAGMAKGGSGDVLTGILGALLAQGYPMKEAARCGVYLHGLCGDLCAKQFRLESYLPSDMIEMLKMID